MAGNLTLGMGRLILVRAMVPPSPNVVRQRGHVTAEDRATVLGQRGAVVWLTGLSGAGKSTIAFAVERALTDAGFAAFVLDGDNVRHGLCADLGFSAADRDENIRRVGEVAALMAEAGIIVIASFISPFREGRRKARLAASAGHFFEVFLDTPLSVCEGRDPKGLYEKARAGTILEFTGISSPYERPEAPELVLPTGTLSLDDCVGRVVDLLGDGGVLKAP